MLARVDPRHMLIGAALTAAFGAGAMVGWHARPTTVPNVPIVPTSLPAPPPIPDFDHRIEDIQAHQPDGRREAIEARYDAARSKRSSDGPTWEEVQRLRATAARLKKGL